MMMKKNVGKSTVAALIVVALAACSTTKNETDSSAGTDTSAATDKAVVTPVVQGPSEAELAALRDQEARKARTVYFDLDDADIKAEYRDLLAAHGAFLAKNPSTVVTIEGHCDERGTPEYNVALGERRAKAVAQVLLSYGVQSAQIKTVSFGEEKPADAGHDDGAWAKNRRGVINY